MKELVSKLINKQGLSKIINELNCWTRLEKKFNEVINQLQLSNIRIFIE